MARYIPRKTWAGLFRYAGRTAPGVYRLCGELTGPHADRTVELSVTRDRLQSLVINLSADSGLFPIDGATPADDLARLRLLCHLGVPVDTAREMTGVYPDPAPAPMFEAVAYAPDGVA